MSLTPRKPVVAVVDDDPNMLESLQDLLESEGYAAPSFSSAGSLLDRGLAGLDVLITDVGMPVMDGFELRELARMERPELPVFLLTGRHEIVDQKRAQDADGCFCKPFDAKALLAAVGEVLRERKSEPGNVPQ